MQEELTLDLNNDGKVVLDGIYDEEDPRSYYLTLGLYNYLIPDASKSVFFRLYNAYRRLRGVRRLNIVDVGCSYGINAALHKYGLSMSELQARYAAKSAEQVSTSVLRTQDERFFRALELQDDLVFTGFDIAQNAVRYAVETRVLDAGVSLDLEREPMDTAASLTVEASDFIISTGAVGYVGRTTFEKLAEAGRARPWVAAFVLRQFSYEPIANMLAQRGYETEWLENALFPQRRFVNRDEQMASLRRLERLGRSPTPLERRGWFAANFFLSRPKEEIAAAPLTDLLPINRLPTATNNV